MKSKTYRRGLYVSHTTKRCTAWNPPPNKGLSIAISQLIFQATTLPMNEPSVLTSLIVFTRSNQLSGART